MSCTPRSAMGQPTSRGKCRSQQMAMPTRPKSVSKTGVSVPGTMPSSISPGVGNILR